MNTNIPVKLIVHHTANSVQTPQFAMTNTYHQQEQFLLSSRGYFVGYHYFIERDGTVIQAKNDNEEGCHTIGQNLCSLGIALAGNFDVETPSSSQLDALSLLLSQKMLTLTIGPDAIFGHRDFAPKDCPGNNLSDDRIRYLATRSSLSFFTKLLTWIKLFLNQ